MPIPKPNITETQKEFMHRCISAISKEYKQDQAIAICYTKWREKK